MSSMQDCWMSPDNMGKISILLTGSENGCHHSLHFHDPILLHGCLSSGPHFFSIVNQLALFPTLTIFRLSYIKPRE